MNEEEMKAMWQSQTTPVGFKPKTEEIIADAEVSYRKLKSMLLWRDVREIAAVLILLPIWIPLGIYTDKLWTWYLMVPAVMWIVGFFTYSRYRQSQNPVQWGGTVREQIKNALSKLEPQIWMLRHINRWYLAPLLGVIIVNDVHTVFVGEESILSASMGIGFVLLVWAVIWAGNQYALKRTLLPERDKLTQILKEIE